MTTISPGLEIEFSVFHGLTKLGAAAAVLLINTHIMAYISPELSMETQTSLKARILAGEINPPAVILWPWIDFPANRAGGVQIHRIACIAEQREGIITTAQEFKSLDILELFCSIARSASSLCWDHLQAGGMEMPI